MVAPDIFLAPKNEDWSGLSGKRVALMTAISTSFDKKRRRQPGRGSRARFARRHRSPKPPELATASDPHLAPVQCEVENAGEYAGNRESGCGDIGVDQLVQVMEQKAALVRLHASLGFEPVLEHS